MSEIKEHKEFMPYIAANSKVAEFTFNIVIFGSLALIVLIAVLPQIPGDSLGNKLLIGVLVIIFGFFFVTVSSRIVGLTGTSSNLVSGMTIATLMGTCLVFISIG